MASAAATIDQAANPKSVDESLWWDSFVHLFSELENSSSSTSISPSLVKKLKSNHAWFLDTVSLFKPPNEKSRASLDSREVSVGSHRLTVKPELKELALQVSSLLCLDEVQSYILVQRYVEHDNVAADIKVQEFLHLVLLHYYIERQCLLKCTRQIFMHALYTGNGSKESDTVHEEALKLISDGFDRNLLSVLQDLLSSKHPEHMDVDLATLWAEEILIENNLVLDTLFLVYYESLCACTGEQWKKLCLLYKGIVSGSFNSKMLAISNEARSYFYYCKVQLLLILIETLDLENLLQMIHDEVPFRQGHSFYTLTDIQEMDAIISCFNSSEAEEASPLVLAWAVFICLISSLPGKQDNNVVMEIDHVSYVQQAFKSAPLSFVLEILECNTLKNLDGPIAGYRSVLRTFISAFIASYEMTLQLEDGTLNLVLDILCRIYQGEESLCVQFWDRSSFIDGPIRCLLCTLEGEFPYRSVEFVRFLSALCEGTWPAECVYNFLDKAVGISSLFEVPSDTCVQGACQIVQTWQPLHVPGVEGLLIPSNTHGQILKFVDGNIALVRWEHTQSGVFVLLLLLARQFYLSCYEETHFIIELLCRLVSFNPAVCISLMNIGSSFPIEPAQMNGPIEKTMRVDLVEIICNLIRNLSPNASNAVMMSMSFSILAKMVMCSPSHVIAVILKTNIFDVALKSSNFDVGSFGSSSGTCFLSGGLARMILIDCEQNGDSFSLTTSVLDFTMQLLEKGADDDNVTTLVVFYLQYVLINHEHWKYKLKHVRWKVTLKVLEMIKQCIVSVSISQKLHSIVKDILLCDSSVHNTLCKIMCITTQTFEKLYISRLYEVDEIEGLQQAVCATLDIVSIMLDSLSKDLLSSLPVFHQAMLSATTKPVPVVTAVMSLISYFHDQEIQVNAAKVLSKLCLIAENAQPYLFGNMCLFSDDTQIAYLRYSVYEILCEENPRNEDLFIAILTLLTSAAQSQPSFFVSLIATKESVEALPSSSCGMKQWRTSVESLKSDKASIINALLRHVERSEVLVESHPYLLLNVLNFLKELWRGGAPYMQILELLRSTDRFWNHLSSTISVIATKLTPSLDNLTGNETLQLGYKLQCHSVVLDIVAYDMFLEKKLLYAELTPGQSSEPSREQIGNSVAPEKSNASHQINLKNIISDWCKKSIMANLIRSYASCAYDDGVFISAKIAASMFVVHTTRKLTSEDTGSLSLSLIEKIWNISKKLRDQPAFSELLSQYLLRGYSVGKELNDLILSDLFYHLQGELEGRKINPGPFKELCHCLLESKFMQTEDHKYHKDFPAHANNVYVFDIVNLRKDLGFMFWNHSEWKASKRIAEKMLLYMQEANSMIFLENSKLSALKALTSLLPVFCENLAEAKTTERVECISEPILWLWIDHICKCLQATIESLVPAVDLSEDIVNFLAAQAELLLSLFRYVSRSVSKKANSQLSLPVCVLVLKTSVSGVRVLNSIRHAIVGLKTTMKFFLMLLLTVVEFCHSSPGTKEKLDKESVEALAEIPRLSLGLLPVLCNCIKIAEYCTLSLATMDLILKHFLISNTWLPVIQKHLHLKLVTQKLQEKDYFASVPIILKFLLTLARVRGGAEMLEAVRFFSYLKALFDPILDNKKHSLDIEEESSLYSFSKEEKPQCIWELGLAVVTAVIYSLGERSSCVDIVDSVILYFFSEKAHLMFYRLSAPDFPSDDHDQKRARVQKTQTSLTALREIEHTHMLICVLAKHQNSWAKAMKEMDSQLRERSIHLLAFISRGSQRIGDSPSRIAPLLCTPTLKEEVELNRRPSFVNSKHGWFSISPLVSTSKTKHYAFSSMALVTKDQKCESTDLVPKTCFSDAAAIQIYRIAFLLLKFLCLQAKEASKRAEEVGFIDLAHFPELPMPEILHGLQDQAISIVTDLCEANKSEQMPPEVHNVCFLLLQIMEKSLFLEFCVSQSCGIRPVSGRVEDFSKEIKLLFQAAEKNAFLRAPLKSLKQIISFVYPGLLQTGGFI